MLDGEVVLSQHVEVKVAFRGVGVGEDSNAADGRHKVCAHIHACFAAGNEIADCHALSIAWKEAMVCQTVQSGAWRSDVVLSRRNILVTGRNRR